jgi:hypothetical protein
MMNSTFVMSSSWKIGRINIYIYIIYIFIYTHIYYIFAFYLLERYLLILV